MYKFNKKIKEGEKYKDKPCSKMQILIRLIKNLIPLQLNLTQNFLRGGHRGLDTIILAFIWRNKQIRTVREFGKKKSMRQEFALTDTKLYYEAKLL